MLNRNNNERNGVENFSTIYEESIIESLLIFGHHFVGIISLHIKEKYSFNRIGDTSSNPKIISDIMESLMDASAKIVQRRILRLIYHKIEIELPFSYTFNFEDSILNAKKEFEKKYPHHPTTKKYYP
jgi:hypothetical protein